MRNKLRSMTCILLVVVLLMSVMLGGCTGFFGARVERNGTDPYQLPELCGIWGANSMNAEIEEYFTTVAASVRQGNTNEANELLAIMRYSLEAQDGGYVLRSWLEGTAGQKLALEDIVISSGSCQIPMEIPDCISDAEQLRSLMTVAALGIDVDIYSLNHTISATQMAQVLISWYEHRIGSAVDYSAVERQGITDEAVLKLLALVPDYEYTEQVMYSETASSTMLSKTLADLLTQFNFYVYGLGSSSMTLLDFVSYCNLFLGIYAPTSDVNMDFAISIDEDGDGIPDEVADSDEETDGSGYKSYESWYELVSVTDISSAVNREKLLNEDALDRVTLAEAMVDILEAGFFTGQFDKASLPDTENSSARIVAEYDLMPLFPDNALTFSPTYSVRYYEVTDLAQRLAAFCYNTWNASGSMHYYDHLSLSGLYNTIAAVERFYTEFIYPDSGYSTHSNDRDYNWYQNRYDTGDYSDHNTVTAAAAMAITWANSYAGVSTSGLRDLYINEADEEWDDELLCAVLDEFGVAYHVSEGIDLDNIVGELERNNIVFARYTGTANDTHCMIIYGFESSGSSMRFFIHDPSASTNALADGNLPGCAKVLDGRYVQHIVSDETDSLIVIGSADPAASSSDINPGSDE